MPLCAIELEDSDAGNEIFGLEYLFYSKIQIEAKRKSNTIPQCTRCQRFGHTKNYCRLEPRCVKCPGNHLFSDCPKKEGEPVQCVNCNEAHSANYRGCPFYRSLKTRTQQNKNKTSSPVSTQSHSNLDINSRNFPSLTINNDNADSNISNKTIDHRSQRISFANAVNGAKSSRPAVTNKPVSNQEETDNGPMHPILKTILSLIKPYIPQIKTFISQLVSSVFSNGF
jgi:hypothetical protein